MIENYLWNIALSEALYPTLQAVEIALRNNICAAGTRYFGDELWFTDPSMLTLQSREQRQLIDAQTKLEREGKPITTGRLIAELRFGFWTSLFNSTYEERLWTAPDLELFSMVFPGIPRTYRSRKRISQRLNHIRRLRNRVFHHEPVWNLSNPVLGVRHSQVVETIGWMSEAIYETVSLLDRFEVIYTREASPYREEVAKLTLQP